MSEFVQKKIRKRRLRQYLQRRKNKKSRVEDTPQEAKFTWSAVSGKFLVVLFACVFLPILVLGGWVYKAYNPGESLLINSFSGLAGKELPKDVDGYTNILLVGTGDVGHDGEDLTDTLIVASLHQETENVVLTSIPRDLFVESTVSYNQKINSLYANVLASTSSEAEGYAELTRVVEVIIGREVHHYVRVDFSTFTNVVDSVGGVIVNVQEPIRDLTYPGPNYTYEPFYLDAGIQVLDGETALKYARSRHTSSDFDRSRRQQELLFALKEAAQEQGVLRSPSKMQDLYETFKAGIDTSLQVREMIRLGGIGYNFDQSKIVMLQLSDDPFSKGGFLYTPPREQYNGQFVLRPLGDDYQQVQRFLRLHYDYPDIMRSVPEVQLFNGTNRPGLAGLTKGVLIRHGFVVSRFGNAVERNLISSRLLAPANIYNDSGVLLDEEDRLLEIARWQDMLEYLLPLEMSTAPIPPEYLETIVPDAVVDVTVNSTESLQTPPSVTDLPAFSLELGDEAATIMQKLSY